MPFTGPGSQPSRAEQLIGNVDDQGAFRQDDNALHNIAQLPNVAGPVILHQPAQFLLRNTYIVFGLFSKALAVVVPQEMGNQG